MLQVNPFIKEESEQDDDGEEDTDGPRTKSILPHSYMRETYMERRNKPLEVKGFTSQRMEMCREIYGPDYK